MDGNENTEKDIIGKSNEIEELDTDKLNQMPTMLLRRISSTIRITESQMLVEETRIT